MTVSTVFFRSTYCHDLYLFAFYFHCKSDEGIVCMHLTMKSACSFSFMCVISILKSSLSQRSSNTLRNSNPHTFITALPEDTSSERSFQGEGSRIEFPGYSDLRCQDRQANRRFYCNSKDSGMENLGR